MTGARPDSWMPMYWGDYFGDTRGLTTLEHGAYLLLIGAYWRTGKPLPDDADYLSHAAGVSRKQWFTLSRRVMGFFSLRDGEWHHKRIELELVRSSNAYAKRAAAAMQRWSKADVTTTTATTIDKKEKKEGAVRATKIDLSTWVPNEEDRTYAKQRGLDPDRVLQDIQQWATNAEAKRLKKDPHAFWQTWCRREADKLRGHKTGGLMSPNGNGSYSAPPANGRASDLKIRANVIATSGRSMMSVTDHEAKEMVQLGLLTAEQAKKAGYNA